MSGKVAGFPWRRPQIYLTGIWCWMFNPNQRRPACFPAKEYSLASRSTALEALVDAEFDRLRGLSIRIKPDQEAYRDRRWPLS